MPLVNKKKVTIGLPEEVVKWGKIHSVKTGTSLSVMFENYLREQMKKENQNQLKAVQ